jgi:hypothetical protein
MSEPKLELFNLEGLIRNINQVLADDEEPIKLGEFCPKKVFFKKSINISGIYPLLQPHEFEFMHLLNRSGKIGYIKIKAGYTDPDSDYSGGYESIRLRIKHPLELKDGKIIPKCSIEILEEVEEGIKPCIGRYEWNKEKKDLSSILPTKWFLV